MGERIGKVERKTNGVVIDYDLLYRIGQIIDQVGFDMEMQGAPDGEPCFCAKHAHMEKAIAGMNDTLRVHMEENYPEGTILGNLLSDELYQECEDIEAAQVERVENMFAQLSEKLLSAALAGDLDEDTVN